MPWIEKRSRGGFRIVFRFEEKRYSQSILTQDRRTAQATLARLEDNLRRVRLGTLSLPNDVDVADFLLSDGRRTVQNVESHRYSRLRELCDAYLASIPESAIEKGSRAMLAIHCRHLCRVLLPSFKYRDVTLGDLQQYVNKRAAEYSRGTKNVSAVTIRKEIRTFSAIWKWAKKSELVAKDFPCDGVRYPKQIEKPPFQTLKQIQARIARGDRTNEEIAILWESLYLTDEELRDFLAHARTSAPFSYIYPMMLTAAHTGMRRSELLRSEVDDIDLQSKTLVIREKKRVRGTNSMRTVPMSSAVEECLGKWLGAHPGGRFTFYRDRLEGTKAIEQISPSVAHKDFRRATILSEWKDMRGWHVLRHTFCSTCASKGVDQRIINTWVGHQTDEMVRRYRHLFPDEQLEAIRGVFE